MKNLFLSFTFLFLCLCSCLTNEKDKTMNVMSFNVRYDNPTDSINQWTNRKDFAADLIKFYNVDIFGCQEVLHNQLNDLLERLTEYDYIGVGRIDGKEKGEYAPIFYKKERFSVVKNGNFWLAENINEPGKLGWDAACERIATWGIFKDKITGKKFFFLNTHLDHAGKVARHKGAELVLDQSKKISEGLPIMMTGDFNAVSTDDPIQVLTNKQNSNHVTDIRDISAFKYGPDWTFHNFGRIPYQKRGLIDYIFVKGDFTVLRYGVLTETLNEIYPSDHCPVMATMKIQ